MGRVGTVLSLILSIVLIMTTGCLDSSGPSDRLPKADYLPGLVVSAPIHMTGSATENGRLPAASPASVSLVYVSVTPGSVPDGLQATIVDHTTGATASTSVVDGGFDPVAVLANVGDTLAVEITRSGFAGPIHAVQLVMVKRPPAVVRTNPPPQKVDVPLNSIMVVVFSTPIDSSSLTTGSVQLWRDTSLVSGSVRLSDTTGLRAEFHPDSLLASQTAYRLIVTQAVRDVNGTPLEAPQEVPFTTGTLGSGLVFASVSAGANHTCALTTSGAAYCWGANYESELGIGTSVAPEPCVVGAGYSPCSTTPVPVSGGLNFRMLSAGAWNTCGVTIAGAAYCWGYFDLGADTVTLKTCPQQFTGCATPIPVSGGLTFKAVSAGREHTCGVTTDGVAYCWGGNVRGGLGNGTTDPSWTPVPVAGGLTFATVSAGDEDTCGVTTSGAAYCWGGNYAGQLGDSTTTDSPRPVAVTGGLTFAEISVGSSFVCGLTTTGTGYCWGVNGGMLGTGTLDGPEQCPDTGTLTDTYACSRSPVPVAGGLTFTTISAGAGTICGATPTGAGYCWGGRPFTGDLGNGTTGRSAMPVAIIGGFSFAVLSPGNNGTFHTCGVTTGGVAYCWGANLDGELGTGTTTWSSVPVVVAGQP